jgi:hypothetical protein
MKRANKAKKYFQGNSLYFLWLFVVVVVVVGVKGWWCYFLNIFLNVYKQ